MVTYTCNPSTWVGRLEGQELKASLSYIGSLRQTWAAHLKKRRRRRQCQHVLTSPVRQTSSGRCTSGVLLQPCLDGNHLGNVVHFPVSATQVGQVTSPKPQKHQEPKVSSFSYCVFTCPCGSQGAHEVFSVAVHLIMGGGEG